MSDWSDAAQAQANAEMRDQAPGDPVMACEDRGWITALETEPTPEWEPTIEVEEVPHWETAIEVGPVDPQAAPG
jgi:hypothetical protein